MKTFETKLEKTKNGEFLAKSIYPAKPIVIGTSKGDKEVGTQPSYIVENLISKDKLFILREYLQEQLDQVLSRYKAALDVMKKLEGIDADKLKIVMEKIPSAKYKGKKLKDLDELAGKVLMKVQTQKQLKELQASLDEIKKQIEFIDKNFS